MAVVWPFMFIIVFCIYSTVLIIGLAELELIIVSLCKSGFKLCLGVFYRPPSSHSTIFDNNNIFV